LLVNGAAIEAFSKWARLALRLFHRKIATAKLKMLSTQPLPEYETSIVSGFAA
jgi:hypothetical protein